MFSEAFGRVPNDGSHFPILIQKFADFPDDRIDFVVGHREEMADRRLEISQQTENELKQRIVQLEALVEKERADKLMFMEARDQALERARAAEKLLGKDLGSDLSF